MATDTIDHRRLTELVEGGAVQGTQVVGQPGGWSLRVRHGAVEHTLATQRSGQARVFRRLETLISYLKELGIQHFDVDATDYEAEAGKTHVRADRAPDRSEVMGRAHEAAAHDRWFREQVQEAIKEADDPNTEWASHEAVKQDMARQRAELLARIKGGGA